MLKMARKPQITDQVATSAAQATHTRRESTTDPRTRAPSPPNKMPEDEDRPLPAIASSLSSEHDPIADDHRREP